MDTLNPSSQTSVVIQKRNSSNGCAKGCCAVFILVSMCCICASIVGLFSLYLLRNTRYPAYNLYSSSSKVGMKVEKRTVQRFTKLSLKGFVKVNLSQGDTETISVEAPENILNQVTTTVENGTLNINPNSSFLDSVFNQNRITVNIQYKELTDITLENSSELKGNGVKFDTLNIAISGNGKANLDVSTQKLIAQISGTGELTLSGSARKQDITVNGSGNYFAQDLISSTADIVISDSAKVTVNVKDRLSAEISGAGVVNYYGNPQITKQDVFGKGVIRKVE